MVLTLENRSYIYTYEGHLVNKTTIKTVGVWRYSSHKIYGENNRYVQEVEILATTKLTILSQNLCSYAVSRESIIELLMLVSDFMVNYKLKLLKGISVECMECLNENAQKEEKKTDPVHHGVRTIKSLPVPNFSILHTSKPEPNMLKILPIIPSSTSQKFTHYFYFILISLPIIPILCF